jgi:hypothetical protein
VTNWPTPVLRLAKAIAVAEGSNPGWNNPLDMTYAFGQPVLGKVNADGVLHFDTLDGGLEAGWQEVSLMLNGRSHVYKLTDTLEQVGQKYSNGDPNWAKNVAEFLGVPVTTTLAELAV